MYTRILPFCLVCIVGWWHLPSLQAQSDLCQEPESTLFSLFEATGIYEKEGTQTLSSGHYTWIVIGRVTPAGQKVYTADPASLRFWDKETQIDAIPTADLFKVIARQSLEQAVALGHSSCDDPFPARVQQPACVERVGEGDNTLFIPCEENCCWREYLLDCPSGGVVQPVLVGAGGEGCTSDLGERCDETCGDE